MRDLHANGGADRRPFEASIDLAEEHVPQAAMEHIDTQYRAVRREQKMASVAVMLMDWSKMLDPVVELLCDRALRWAALIATVGLTAYALRQPSWERAAIVAGFAVLAPWVIRAGRR